jgi:hypothetical protein
MALNLKNHHRYHSFTITKQKETDCDYNGNFNDRDIYAVTMIKDPAQKLSVDAGEVVEEYFRTKEEAEDFVKEMRHLRDSLVSEKQLQKIVEDYSSFYDCDYHDYGDDNETYYDGPSCRAAEEDNLAKQEKLRKVEAERIRTEEENRKKKEEDDAVKELFTQHKPSHRKFL